ncbi:MAG: hypothetical protein AB7F75_11180 [Planctomycetota bacterium]
MTPEHDQDEKPFMNLLRRELQNEQVPDALWRHTLSRLEMAQSHTMIRRRPWAAYAKYAAALLIMIAGASMGWHHLEPQLSGSHYEDLALTDTVDGLKGDTSLLRSPTDVTALLERFGVTPPSALIDASAPPMNAMGHLVSFIGARKETVNGIERAVLYISCCNEPVVIVVSMGGSALALADKTSHGTKLFTTEARKNQATLQLISRHEHDAKILLGKFV